MAGFSLVIADHGSHFLYDDYEIFEMTFCNHTKLELLPEEKNRLRCQHCHLTIKADDLGDNYCPECFEMYGEKRYDFEKIEVVKTNIARYRCEVCGVIIESGQQNKDN